jgi:dolichyl-phosphate beta-glucosyltransferase
MTATPPSLSIVVPAFNEARRIPSTLYALSKYFIGAPYPIELIVVDDGSRDSTLDVIREIAPSLDVPLRVIRYVPNRGKGFALKVGFSASQGDRVLFTDADLATPIEDVERLQEALDRGFDIAIGSRKRREAMIAVRQPWLRETLGKGFTLIVRTFIFDTTDATCGFKLYRGDVGRDLFARMRVFDWSFDAELLWIGRLCGARLVEVPVRWSDQAGTKVNLWRDVIRSLLGIARIRAYSALGRYATQMPLDLEIEKWAYGGSKLRHDRVPLESVR